jgi:RNA polymerase sigma factor (sigma-70 family)
MQAGPVPDSALVEAGRRGDQTAFAQIVERYQDAVYAVSYATTRDRALADDVTQDTFVAAWRYLGQLRDRSRLPAWLCGIARNRARDALKQRRREHANDATEPPDLVDPSTPFDVLSNAEAEQLVATALDAVPAAYREPLVLFYIEQRSVDDVARALGLSPRTTNKRLSRGRRHLAARVGALVERKLSLRGPKRDVVAGVLAAIGLLGSASHVDASPATVKGSIMPKLAIVTVLVATVGGLGGLAASVDSSPRPSRSAAAASTPRTPSTPSTTSVAATPWKTGNRSRQPPASPPQLAPVTTTIPDCASVALHLAQLKFDKWFDKQVPAEKYQNYTRALTERCKEERWSDERRACTMTLSDSDDELACHEGAIGTDEELADLPPELRCDALAQHLAALVTAPDGKFGIVVKKMADRGRVFDLQRVAVQVRDETREQCDRLPWSLSIRRCIAASKTHDETSRCW